MLTWRLLVGLGIGASSVGTTGCTSASYTWGAPQTVSQSTLSINNRAEFAAAATIEKATLNGTVLSVRTIRACTSMRDIVTETVLKREEERAYGKEQDKVHAHRSVSTGGPLLLGLLAPAYALLGGTYSLIVGLNGVEKGSSCVTESIGSEGSPGYIEANAEACGAGAWAHLISYAIIVAGAPIASLAWHAGAFSKAPPERVARSSMASTAMGLCSATAAKNVSLFAALGDRVVELGKTDAQGKLEVKLDQFIDAKALLAGGARWTLKLAVGGATETPIEVKTDAFFAAMGDAVWKATDEPTCAKQKTREACINIARYASLYPAGKHAREAAALNVAVVPVFEGRHP